ncbi:MAG: hypothetical protein JKX80_01140 [Candidatus Pacebacteria bacterium]|nr:hypothetical protein [Candidatus Paceibacterota bacterium]
MELEQLTPEELDAHVSNGTFRLAFVGMSNVGKSYRSRVLHGELSFLWFNVDEGIQKELNFASMEDISNWLGQPTEKTYGEREERYLEIENSLTKNASMQTDGKNLVFDTTGSDVHLKENTLKILRENCLVVHLDAGDDSLEKLVEKYFEMPKPVAWCGHLNREPNETSEEALRRCYPTLLEFRLKQYRKLSHLNIPAHKVHDKNAEETLQIIKSYLAKN